ncbi:unnamed protein product [Victoria cruziana]
MSLPHKQWQRFLHPSDHSNCKERSKCGCRWHLHELISDSKFESWESASIHIALVQASCRLSNIIWDDIMSACRGPQAFRRILFRS